METERLVRFLNPRSIAVIGGDESERVLMQCRKLGYTGPMWAVNPKRSQMAGITCFGSLSELPEGPDAAFVGIPAEPTIEVVRQLDALGAGGAVCLASGFKEVGADGAGRQRRLCAAAGNMPVLGPNCYGYVNALLGAALFPDQHGLTRTGSGVALVSSSGNIGINLTLQQRGLPIAWLITIGNQAMLGIEGIVDAALENPRIRAIGLHIEGLNDLPRFIELAEEARRRKIPIVVLKTGVSDIGARITMSHTATMAGESGLYKTLFERLGIGLVNTPEILLETLKLACVHGPLPGNRIASMSCSGGEASLVADLSTGRDIRFPAITGKHRLSLQETLNEFVAIDNPLDYHTFIWGDRQRLNRTFRAMMEGNYDLVLLVIDFPFVNDCDMDEWKITVQAFADACRITDTRGATVTCLSENYHESIRELLLANGIVPLHGVDQALSAIEAMSRIGMAWDGPFHLPVLSRPGRPVEPERVMQLDEYESKSLLKSYGIRVPAAVRITERPDTEVARRVGYPLVVKALCPTMVHKTDQNAVVIGVENDSRFFGECDRIRQISGALLIEEMIRDTVAELVIGVGYDKQFGHYLNVGFGGTLVELVSDTRLLLFPVSDTEIRTALRSLGTWPLLDGFRGRAKADVDAVVGIIRSISALIQDRGQDIVEVEINPVLVRAQGCGAIAADALVALRRNNPRRRN